MVSAAALKSAIMAVWFVVFAIAERMRGFACRPPGKVSARWPRNLALAAMNAGMSPLFTLPLTAAATRFDLWARPEAIPAWVWLVLDLLILDAWIYLWHRANHEIPLLWRFHQVHHRDEVLDVTSAVRFHPGEVFLSALARAPIIVVLDISLTAVIVFEALVFLAAVFHHSAVALPPGLERMLRLVIVTPSHHWLHHNAVRAATDSNYATMLTLWDRLGRSFNRNARSPDLKIGVEGQADRPLRRLVGMPFVKAE
jgi:sterol desaturase/sphingolipid hydroxylase (fatty acid hydroxylase superfamily)